MVATEKFHIYDVKSGTGVHTGTQIAAFSREDACRSLNPGEWIEDKPRAADTNVVVTRGIRAAQQGFVTLTPVQQ